MSIAVEKTKNCNHEKQLGIQIGEAEIPQKDRFLHTLIIGAPGTGKTSLMKSMISQDLKELATGKRIGITVIEPEEDLSVFTAKIAQSLGVPVIFIDPKKADTSRLNPLEGSVEDAAEIINSIVNLHCKNQDPEFQQVQERVLKNTVKLLKALYGDNATIQDLGSILSDPSALAAALEKLEGQNEHINLIRFFKKQISGKENNHNNRAMLELKVKLKKILDDEIIMRGLVTKQDINDKSRVNFDNYLENGGVLIINPGTNIQEQSDDILGKLALLCFKKAVFRRPGNERTRTPHFLYIDGVQQYITSEFQIMLALGYALRCAVAITAQEISDLHIEGEPASRDIVRELLRNKIVFNLKNTKDAQKLTAEMGQSTVCIHCGEEPPVLFDLMNLSAFTCACKFTCNGIPQLPKLTRIDL